MLPSQTLLWAFTLFNLVVSSVSDPLGKLHSSHGRISHRSYHHRAMQAENESLSVPFIAQPFVHDIAPIRAVKRGPRIIDYKLVSIDAKGSKNVKRAPDDLNSVALFNFPNCLLCQGKRKDDLGLSVSNNFQARQMVDMMELGGLMGECLFYGQRPPGVSYMPQFKSLSRPTTKWACQQGRSRYRTIWQLWPYNQGSGSCEVKQNYYCLNPWTGPDCCWLNPLLQGPNVHTQDDRIDAAMIYFQQMSKAMAMTCTGEVFVMIDNPDDIVRQQPGVQPSIWLTHELPTLQDLFRMGDIFKLTAITFATKKMSDITYVLRDRVARDFEWDDELARAIKEKKLELLRTGQGSNNATLEHTEEKRSSCGSAAVSEPPGVDIFG
ncbi:hypothetical protein DE146DRAFT_758008 [Phaeosphaeria sp. MPI-PUGE-AT-0046c]|nr:hypothetical protein DE146DRAFT_758008 [Phaeosphaeria sp. MPI-PUGE-AT-0046c]